MDLPQPQQFRQQSFSSSDPHIKRTKERSVAMAQQLVIIWRNYYENGEITDLGHQHLSLQDAANKVGIPKKTLEDYYAIFRYAIQSIRGNWRNRGSIFLNISIRKWVLFGRSFVILRVNNVRDITLQP
jgi:hypothetical protein